MQTHEDRQHGGLEESALLKALTDKATRMVKDKSSQITCGKDGETELASWEHDGIHVRHLPDDEHGILRISCGGGIADFPCDYVVIRGGVGNCIDLLERAISALKHSP